MARARMKRGHSAIGRKIQKLKGEGKKDSQAKAIALDMARRGDLGAAARSAAPAPKTNKKKRVRARMRKKR